MKLLTRIVTGVVLVLAAHGTAHADSTWVLTSGTGAWLTGINWNNGVPGATGTTTNSTDIATFSTMTATGTSVVDSNRNVGGIIFSGTSTFGIHLTTGTLRLTNGGTIQTTSAQGAHDDQVRSRVSIQGNGGSATFLANGSGTMSFTNTTAGVVGNSTSGNTTTLYLDGTGAGRISGGPPIISDGTAGGKLAIVKNGSGVWYLGGGTSGTWTGGFTLNAGRIGILLGTDALGSGSVTLNSGTVSSNDGNARTVTNSILVGGNFGISNATNPGSVTLSGSMDLGGATRTVTVVASGGTFSGLISNGGLTKSGTGNLTLSNTNTYSGDTLVQSGTLFVGSDLALQNSGFDTSGAGRLSLAGRTAATFGGLLGSVNLATSATYAGVSALTLNPQTGTSYDYGGVIANGTSAGMSLTKTGLGSQRLTGVSTYTGTTFVNAGRLEIAGSGNLANTAGVVINGSGAELKWNSSTALSQPITFTQGTISGTGAIGVAVTVATNDILSPGNSPGSQAYTAGLTWSPGGTYQWEINNATGAADVNWDILNVSGGALDLSGLSSGSTFALDLTTLTGTVPGPMANYVDGQSYTFSLASYDSLTLPGEVTGDDLTSLFTLSFANWRNTAPSLANVSVVNNTVANTIDLVIVPEPTGLAVAGIAFAAAGWLLRRRRTAA
jgi:autotransporter-associated beta strand protein